MKKIAFLFLIYDTINLEELWHKFFLYADKDKYSIYIHYKNNKPLQYFEKYKLNNCIDTKYADISLVKAQNILLKEALKDPNNSHFILLSNSCVPFKNFDFIYNNLDDKYSYFNIMGQNECFPRCIEVLKFIDEKFIQKASQWCILNRKHAALLIFNTIYLDWFKNIYAADEHCYISFLFFNNLNNEIIFTLNSANNATTFTNWEGMIYKYPSQSGLKNYNFISKDEIIYLINSKCFFGRKFLSPSYSSFLIPEYINLFIPPNKQHLFTYNISKKSPFNLKLFISLLFILFISWIFVKYCIDPRA